ncbi:odorant receptor 13a-like [Odontomachus brunneus]|uniref:odorant receptor 13a-like n=1 Tax=Odontomachus brunneus TaxID=486640 RepID=UPI0013F2560C|nr:odorant receptor 13a-like [Odontomachus brunneus]
MIFTSTISPSLKSGLRFLSVWPDVPYAAVFRLIYMLFILVVQYFQYLYVFAHFKLSELQDLVDSLPPTLDSSLTIMKLVTLWKNRRVVSDILTSMDTDWRECVKVDQHLDTMTEKASVSHFCSNALLSFNTFVAVLYYVSDYTLAVMHFAKDDNDTSRPFPMKILFPFEAEQSPIYELLVVVLFLHAMLNVYTLTTLNALIITLVLHASGQIDIICQEFQTTSEKASYHGSSEGIGMLIEKHNRIITFSENLDELFSFMALMQIFWNTLVICSLGLLIITSVHNEASVGLVRTIFAYGAIMMEIFIFCFAGEYLSLKSRSLADAAYDSLWYNMSSSQGKNILFVIMRSQKQLTITAGGITNLSLEAFTNIMKASASYVSVLNAMY